MSYRKVMWFMPGATVTTPLQVIPVLPPPVINASLSRTWVPRNGHIHCIELERFYGGALPDGISIQPSWLCTFVLTSWCFGHNKYFNIIGAYMCRGNDPG